MPRHSRPPRDVLLFAAQGSRHHLSDPQLSAVVRAQLGQNDAKVFSSFLQSCHSCFRSELDSLSPGELVDLAEGRGDIRDAFPDGESLLLPLLSWQDHAVTETMGHYMHQVLALMALDSLEKERDAPPRTVAETAGVCTGTLVAILAASFSSYLSASFVAAAIGGFRLAFRIGLRTAQFARRDAPDREEDDGPGVLTVFGLSAEELQERVSQFNSRNSLAPPDLADQLHQQPQISASFGSHVVSVSGQKRHLEKLRSELVEPAVQCRWAHIHGYYHGGVGLEPLVHQVLQDCTTRSIDFPTWHSLHAPIRSTSTGDRMIGPDATGVSLLETALRSIFVAKADWTAAQECLSQSVSSILDRDPEADVRVLALGPGSPSLVSNVNVFSDSPRLSIIDNVLDLSAHSTGHSSDAIAIVGLSVNYPGGKGQDEFWDTLAKGISTVSEIPSSRFDLSCYAAGKGGRSLSAKHGNFLASPFDFDPGFFNISPREAKSMDPQQRLLLLGALDALEDAGYSPDATPSFQRDSFGVYVGVATGDYTDNLRDDIDVYYSPGTLRAFLSGRISYAFGWHGPSVVLDTACSSSAVALYHACRALQNGECAAALAGGVNTISSPDMYMGLSRAHFLSPTGQCKAWDEAADGYCRSEGCGLVVVKRLADALAEGDRIYGVIRGIGINQCGTAKSITHPDAGTQAGLFRQVLSASRTSPDSISVIEAHGTGTQAGDQAEVTSLQAVFGQRPPENPLHLLSVKGNIGHAEAASGLAGLAKLLLMLQKQQIPPQASFKKLNPRLASIVAHNIQVPTDMRAWENANTQRHPRRAMLNSFGAAGSNACVIVEEYVPARKSRPRQYKSTAKPQLSMNLAPAITSPRSHHVLCLSAKNSHALDRLRRAYISLFEGGAALGGMEISIQDLCYTANARRVHHDAARVSIVGSGADEMVAKLRQWQPGVASRRADQPGKPGKKTTFVFSGQGSVHRGMGSELLTTAPVFREVVDECDAILSRNAFPSVRSFLAGGPEPDSASMSAENSVVIEQCACVVLEVALARLWMSWGVMPDVVVGHSIGEYAALCIAGCIDLQDTLLLAAQRARLMATKCVPNHSGMLTCRVPDAGGRSHMAQVLGLLGEAASGDSADLSAACLNSPQDLVVAGPLSQLDVFAERCKTMGYKQKRLPVPFGFHSCAMDPILDEFAVSVASVKLRPPTICVGSTLYGRLLKPGEAITRDYLVRHLREPVRFSAVLEELQEQQQTFALEIGPSSSTESMFRGTMEKESYTFAASLKPTEAPWSMLTIALRALWLQDEIIDWRQVYRGSAATFLPSVAPRYPLSLSRFALPYREPATSAGGRPSTAATDDPANKPRFDFLSSVSVDMRGNKRDAAGASAITAMPQISPWIKAHSVGGVPLCPASVYIEMALELLAVSDAPHFDGNAYVLEEVAFDTPLVCTDPGTELEVKTVLREMNSLRVEFSCSSEANNKTRLHCTGCIRPKSPSALADVFARKEAYIRRQLASSFQPGKIHTAQGLQTFSARTIYDVIFPRVVEYSDPFRSLKHLTISSSGLEGHGVFQLVPAATQGAFVCPPAFTDTMLHAAGFIANTHVRDVACICAKVDAAVVDPGLVPAAYTREMQVYCSLVETEAAVIADAYAMTSDGKVVALVEGMYFKKVPLSSFRAHLSRIAQQQHAGLPGTAVALTASRPAVTHATVEEDLDTGRRPHQRRHERTPSCEVETNLGALLGDVCGIEWNSSMSNHSLVELGIDSLLLIELGEALGTRFPGVQIGKEDLESCRTIADLVRVLMNSDASTKASTYQSPDLLPALTKGHSPTIPTPPGHTTPVSSSSPIEALFFEMGVLMQALGEDERSRTLSSLGVDSLLSIEMAHELQARFGLDIGGDEIPLLTFHKLEHLYAEQLTTSLANRFRGSDGSAAYEASVRLQRATMASGVEFPRMLQKGSRANSSSVILFHDGSGSCSMYASVDSLDRDVYGIFSLDKGETTRARSLDDLAARYIEHGRLLEHEGGMILGGWSFGGVLAYCVANQLRRLGRRVDGLILIDSPPPIDHRALPREVITHIIGGREHQLASTAARQARDGIRASFAHHAALLEAYQPSPTADGQLPAVLLLCTKTMDTRALCGVDYPWLSDAVAREMTTTQWEALLGRRVTELKLNCNHFKPFSKNLAEVSFQLRQACDILEGARNDDEYV